MEHLNAEKIKTLLDDSRFSKNIIIHKNISSTNNHAKELACKGGEEGTVILAEEQTAGRGRMDRLWLSPPCKNILVSLLLKPSIHIERIFSLTLALALSITEAIKKMTGLSAMIKWPNDIYMNNKKLGGILTEFRIKGSEPEYVILGLGLNVNWCPEKEMDILFPSTSILNEYGEELSRNDLIALILSGFEKIYIEILKGNVEKFNKRCNELSMVSGKDISVATQGEIIKGRALGIDEDGALLVRGQDGVVQKVLNGDASLRI